MEKHPAGIFRKKAAAGIWIYQNHIKFEKFNDDQKDVILAISMGQFKIRLNKKNLRKAVKKNMEGSVKRNKEQKLCIRYWNEKGFSLPQIWIFKKEKKEKLYDPMGDALIGSSKMD
jgi:hypothetical protein